MNKYIGNTMQLYGVQLVKIEGGKGDGMRLLKVKSGAGLEFTISLDRCADISELSLKGVNFCYIAPCGYVSNKLYDNKDAGFMYSFTGGFMTTCGLTAVGANCVDEGVDVPLHGTVSHSPAENFRYWVENDEIHIVAEIREAALFRDQLVMERHYVCPLFKNELYLTDTIKNIGRKQSPFMMLYHCNMGYPLLSENAVLNMSVESVQPRDAHAATGLDRYNLMEKPQSDYEEMCYNIKMKENPVVELYNPDIKMGIRMMFDINELDCFTEWKMMGDYEYVLGLEPGTCTTEGRKHIRDNGLLKFIEPGEIKTHHLKFEFFDK